MPKQRRQQVEEPAPLGRVDDPWAGEIDLGTLPDREATGEGVRAFRGILVAVLVGGATWAIVGYVLYRWLAG